MQYARSKVDYAISKFIYMVLSDMNLRIGKVKNYNNILLVSPPSFKIGTNLKINLDEEKDKPDVKSKREETMKTNPDIKTKKADKQDIKTIKTKLDNESNKRHKQDVKMMKTKPDTHKEEKAALISGIYLSLQYGGYSSDSFSSHLVCVDQNSSTCYKCPQILR